MFGEKKTSKRENGIVLLSSYRIVLLCFSDSVCQRLGNTYSMTIPADGGLRATMHLPCLIKYCANSYYAVGWL